MSTVHTTEALEQACASAWPAMVEDKIGAWRLRAADSYTGRANSALAVGDPGVPLAEALHAVCEFAHAHRIAPMIQAVRGGRVEPGLATSGWRPAREHGEGHEVSVLVGPLGAGSCAEILPAPTPGWWELVAGTTEPSAAQRHVLTTGDIGYGVVRAGTETAGAVRSAVVDELLYVSRLTVRAEFRRRGLAAALMAAAGSWAGPRGAGECVLQVAVGNTAALALYARLGFTEHHQYRYWVPSGNAACEDRAP